MLTRPRAVCVSSEPDAWRGTVKFRARHVTAFFSRVFPSILSSSAELFLAVSSFCGNCNLSGYLKRDRVFIHDILVSVILTQIQSDLLDLGPYRHRIFHRLQFCALPVGHKVGGPDTSRPTPRVGQEVE